MLPLATNLKLCCVVKDLKNIYRSLETPRVHVLLPSFSLYHVFTFRKLLYVIEAISGGIARLLEKMFVHRLFHKILLRNIPHRQSVLETDNLRETIINIWSVEIKKNG